MRNLSLYLLIGLFGFTIERTVTFQTQTNQTIIDFDSGQYSLEVSGKELYVGKGRTATGFQQTVFHSDKGVFRVPGNGRLQTDLLDIGNGGINSMGKEQWQVVYRETFDTRVNSTGWSKYAVHTCRAGNAAAQDSSNQDILLGGQCNFGTIQVSKTFPVSGTHRLLRIKANVNFYDEWLNGAYFYIKNGANLLYLYPYSWCSKILIDECRKDGMNACAKPNFPDNMGNLVEVDIIHNSTSVQLTFGANTMNSDPCSASWGIDNIELFTLS